MIFEIDRRLTRLISLIVLIVVGTLISVAALAGGLMHPPSGKTYSYQGSPNRPTCTTASHAYDGWIWFNAADGTTRAQVLVCDSSQGTQAGWGWRAITQATATQTPLP